MANNSSVSPRMAMWVMADQGTCSWANSGMYHLSSEPRVIFDNSVTYTYANTFETYYEDLYGNLFIMNSVLEQINNGMVITGTTGQDDTEMIKAAGYFIQGLSLGYLGLVYDKAFIVKVPDGNQNVTASPYMDVIEAAIVSLDSVIKICSRPSVSFHLPDNYINGSEYNEDELMQLANSFAARFLVLASRNKADNQQVDWNRVLTYANNGITRDLAPYMDGAAWNSWFRHYTVRPGWARIDCRIINLIDPDYPWRYPDDGHNPEAAYAYDKRLNTDFTRNTANNMKPERGFYHYSDYEYVRYPLSISTTTGDSPVFLVSENDLIRAEALAETGNIVAAVQIINEGTRVTRGELDPLNENISKQELLDAIFYERDIELIQTGFGLAFFDMRRRDMLQYGTMLNFPIPGKDLMTMELPSYTFGGEANADGINTSNGGWFPVE
ncbi:MAG: hypothetical protein B6I19_09675 [Bacteroidetes bacterium 4572_114]|nr:MAG: hypothetical protein B6I19_09675 [Bacteroidetes bacterium 4572_114]